MTDSYGLKTHRKALFLLLVLLIVAVPMGIAYMLNVPQTGSDTYSKGGATVDMSNADQGYIMVKRESSKRQKFRVTKGKVSYDYDINGEGRYEVIPLQMGSGTYSLTFYEQKSGDKYAAKFKDKSIKVTLVDDNICFLYPSQYVNYDENSDAVKLADELCAGLTSDLDKYKAIAAYVKTNVVYDYMKAMRVVGNELKVYLPDPDSTIEERMGICFDFASLTASMLRSQGVATKMCIGMAGKTYHAWNEVLVEGKWAQSDLTFAVTNTKIDKDEYTVQRVY